MRATSLSVVFGSLTIGLFIGTSVGAAVNPFATAISRLQTAKSELSRAPADRAGHRDKAIELTNQAIRELNEGDTATAPPSTTPLCTGCVAAASSVTAVNTQSMQFSTSNVQSALDARKPALLRCFEKGWDPKTETVLDYGLEFDGVKGTVVLLKGPMFGKALRTPVLECLSTALSGASLGKAYPDAVKNGIKSFSITLKVLP